MGVNVTKNDTFKFSVTDDCMILKPKDVTQALYSRPTTPKIYIFFSKCACNIEQLHTFFAR